MRTFLLLLVVFFAPLLSMCQLLDNYDTCRTHVYYQNIGSAVKETHIEKARTVQDNGIINAGYSKQAGNKDAIIIKQNINGQVIWQKEYGDAAYDEQFTDWRELPNRQLLLGGIAKNRSTLQSVFFLMLLSADGNIIWQKSFADIAASSNITNVKIYPDYFGGYFFAAEAYSSIIYGMISNTGIVNWQQSLTTNPGTKLIAAVSHYGQLLIATNTVDAGFRVSNFYYVNYYWTGNPTLVKYTIKLGGANQNSNYILHDFEQYSQYTYFSGIRSVNNAPYELIRVNINQGYLREALETIVTPGVAIDSFSRSAININGDVVSFTAGRKNDRLHTVQLTGSQNYPSNVVWSSSYHLPDSIVLKGNIKTWDNGYVFFGFKELPGGNQKTIQLKTDSASLSPSCINRQHANFSVVRNQFPTDTATYTYNNVHRLTDFNFTALASNGIIDTLTVCKELSCPRLPLSDSCIDSYQKLYKAYEPGSYATNVLVVNGRTFVSGIVQPMDYIPEQTSSFIAEMNRNGQVVNQKKYVIGIGSTSRMYKGKDSSLLLYGFTSDAAYYSSVFLAKIDTNLNVIWIKSLRLGNTPHHSTNQSIGEVKQGSDGSYFIQYSDGITFGATTIYLTKLDINGNHLWSKVYRASYPGEANLIKGTRLEVSGGNVYIMCRNAYNSYSSSVLLKVTENNGNLLWCKKYSNAGKNIDLSGIMTMYNNELLIGGMFRNDNLDPHRNILMKTGTDGTISSAVSLKNAATNTAPTMQFMNNGKGNIYMNSVFYSTPPYSNPYQINVTVNNNLDIIASKKRPSIINNRGSDMAIGAGGQLYETGAYTTSYNFYSLLYLIKFSPDGSVGTCPSDTMLLQKVMVPNISVTDISCIQSDSFFILQNPPYRADQFYLATAKLVCASVPGCNSLGITGSDSICDKSLQYTFRAVRNSGCSAPLQWLYDNSNAQVIVETDSSITLRFLATGSLLLKARFTSNCTQYIDSLLIHVMGNGPVLHLGADTSLCPGASLVLNAKKGFRYYRWQDGSADSTFTIKSAGLYYVTVADSCNTIFTDSIKVQVNGNGPLLNLGPDNNFCSTDTIILNARAGFLSYHWQDGSTDSVFTVTASGSYYVTVTDACSNNFRDTIKINTYRRATSLNLGVDTIFCKQGIMQINALAGFKNYLWQDGSVDSILIAHNTGLYYVQVTDSCGTIFTDSIRILADNIIVFDIGPDTSVCKADSLLLQVTNGLNNYTWWPQVNMISQGTATITVFPNTSTSYYISAIKQNGCMVTDSILVNVHTPPLINLGPDVSICAGDSLRLNAGTGFNNYTWSTGDRTASIEVYRAGQYYVYAADNNNCVASDSFSILQLVPLPVTQLPRETAICPGQPMALSAGAGFKNYLWNTGALAENIVVSSMGQYWVTVTNSFGCRQTDSVRINRELALPSGFIKDKDSTICSFETIIIAPSKNFTSYLWSNGSTAGFITVNKAGNYWLKVTDTNGCTGIDSFTLATKDCNIDVFFPNSFTPNNDGLNDIYKPVAYGRLISYHISIYNRYGEKVFERSNISEGWNGELKGVKQERGAFAWQCWYQLSGEVMRHKSGSVLLIR